MFRNVIFVALVAVSVSAHHHHGGPHGFHHRMHELIQKCRNEFDLEPETIKNAELSDEKMKCFGACILKDINVLNASNNTLTVDDMIEHIPPHIPDRDTVINALTECSTKTDDNECELAYQFLDCLEQKHALPPFIRGDHPRHGGPPPEEDE